MDGGQVPYAERVFHASDDLPIFYRDYGEAKGPLTPVLCLPGLTRNSRDFRKLADRLAPTRRVLSVDYRGRGRSGRDPDWRNYRPQVYVNDILDLLAVTQVPRAVVIGTSLGGLLAMALGAARPTALAGVVLNDVGPEIDQSGMARIAGYVGVEKIVPDLAAGAALLKAQFLPAFPDLDDQGWLDYADGTFAQDASGFYRFDYDLKLGDALKLQAKLAASEPADLWSLFRSLRPIPTLLIHGRLSDILSTATVERMRAEKPDLLYLEVGNRGHVPLLNESVCVRAIDDFLARCDFLAAETSGDGSA
jgi:pimeloyl-ACP methyl ester carboxylesterase